MSAQHTPTPWRVYDGQLLRVMSGQISVAGIHHVGKTRGQTDCEAKANARLIAAAPDLLAFAQALDAHWTADFPGGPDNWDAPGAATILGSLGKLSDETLTIWRQCRAALSKALGQDGGA